MIIIFRYLRDKRGSRNNRMGDQTGMISIDNMTGMGSQERRELFPHALVIRHLDYSSYRSLILPSEEQFFSARTWKTFRLNPIV